MGFDVQGRVERYREEAEAEIKTARQRRKKMDALTEQAQAAHKTGRYEVSFDKFCNILALIETDPKRTTSDEMRAMITSNIGSALHFLGEEAAAAQFYEKALEEFGNVRVGWIDWALSGHLPAKRKEYIQARLAQLAAGERPDPSLYLDGYGKTRQFTQEEMDGTDKSWSILQPRTWWYGGYVPSGSSPPSEYGSGTSTAI